MGGPAGVREPMGASRGLRTNRRPAGFRSQWEPSRKSRARISAVVKRPMAGRSLQAPGS